MRLPGLFFWRTVCLVVEKRDLFYLRTWWRSDSPWAGLRRFYWDTERWWVEREWRAR